MDIRIVEIREHEFVEQLTKLLNTSFAQIQAGFKIMYVVGQEINGRKGLYFELSTKLTDVIYSKFEKLEIFQLPSDIEEKFIHEIMSDLILGGVTFLHVEKAKYLTLQDKRDEEYRKMKRTIYLN